MTVGLTALARYLVNALPETLGRNSLIVLTSSNSPGLAEPGRETLEEVRRTLL